MNKEITIVSFHESYPADNGCHLIEKFENRKDAMKYLLQDLQDENEELKNNLKYRLQSTLMFGKPGRYEYTIGDHEYSVAWSFIQPSSHVTNEELTQTLEDYVNDSGKGKTAYEKASEMITTKVHRYCQNEIYKLISCIIRAMAKCPYDDRNVLMHNRAHMIAKYMDEYNL